jgi:hypothetical protein
MIRCWKCKTFVHPENEKAKVAVQEPAPAVRPVEDEVLICRVCGEKNEKGSVRCSKCKTMTLPEIDRIYREMVDEREHRH